jgi:hypothetical protein
MFCPSNLGPAFQTRFLAISFLRLRLRLQGSPLSRTNIFRRLLGTIT